MITVNDAPSDVVNDEPPHESISPLPIDNVAASVSQSRTNVSSTGDFRPSDAVRFVRFSDISGQTSGTRLLHLSSHAQDLRLDGQRFNSD
jgi:hypothetical protein